MRNEFPLLTAKDEPDEAKRNAFNNEQKKKRSEKLDVFLTKGNQGAKFKKIYDRMLAKLELSPNIKAQLGISQAPQQNEKAQDPSKVRTIFKYKK